MDTLVLLGTFFVLMMIGVPIAYSLGLSALVGRHAWDPVEGRQPRPHRPVVDEPAYPRASKNARATSAKPSPRSVAVT